jgi:hypothetical protein
LGVELMAAKIYVAKYIKDPRRWEPLNIGVFVVDEHGLAGRFIGEKDDGSVDKRSVRHLVESTEVYEQWVKYWRRMLADGAIGEILKTTAPQYWIAESGEVWMGEETPENLVKRYFAELVVRDGPEDDPAAFRLRTSVEKLLVETGVAQSPAFTRDGRFESQDLDPPEEFQFQYALQDSRIVVGQRVPLASEPFVHDALWKFSHLKEDIERVAFVFAEDDDVVPHRRHLARFSTVVDVARPSAGEVVREVFFGR